jgi:hypothetical protein
MMKRRENTAVRCTRRDKGARPLHFSLMASSDEDVCIRTLWRYAWIIKITLHAMSALCQLCACQRAAEDTKFECQ